MSDEYDQAELGRRVARGELEVTGVEVSPASADGRVDITVTLAPPAPLNLTDLIERHLERRMIKNWRKRYSNERELEALPRNQSPFGYRAPDLGGESG